ncbi:MAG: hypothetical protein AAGB12_14945, partial [Pseudomonadota bacterium]
MSEFFKKENSPENDWSKAIQACRTITQLQGKMRLSIDNLIIEYLDKFLSCWKVTKRALMEKKPPYPNKPIVKSNEEIIKIAEAQISSPSYLKTPDRPRKQILIWSVFSIGWIPGMILWDTLISTKWISNNSYTALSLIFLPGFMIYFIMRMFQLKNWREKVQEIKNSNLSADKKYKEAIEVLINDLIIQKEERIKRYDLDIQQYKKQIQNLTHRTELLIEKLKNSYIASDYTSITNYLDLCLSTVAFPPFFPHVYKLEYGESTKMLIIEYQLPSQEQFICWLESSYHYKKLPSSKRNCLYENIIYSIVFIVAHVLYKNDKGKNVISIGINGYIYSIKKSIGKFHNTCILSINIPFDKFNAIDI